MSVERALGGIAAATDGSSWSEDDLLRKVHSVSDPVVRDALEHVARAVIDAQRKMYLIFVATHEYLPHADPELGEVIKKYADGMREHDNVHDAARFAADFTGRLHEAIEPLHRALFDALSLSNARDWRIDAEGLREEKQ